MQNINRVVLTGNLTRDPEKRTTASGMSVCKLRVASNSRVKRDGEWTDSPNYFDVTCFGSQADNVSKYLSKGRPVAIDGRLAWREWDQDGQKRQAVEILAESIQFLGDGGGGSSASSQSSAPPVSNADFDAPASSPADDDIPF